MKSMHFPNLRLILPALFVLTACKLPGMASEATSTAAAYTAAAQTMAAQMTQFAMEFTHTPTTAPATVTPPPAPKTPPTLTPTPTMVTPLPSITPIPTLTATAIPCNQAQFVKDVTIPDGTSFAPGKPFTKVWRLKNVGACTWSENYTLLFFNGDKMEGDTLAPLPHAVKPDKEVDVAVDLVAPYEAGEYLGNWMLRSQDGDIFGIGAEANKPFWVQIEVDDGETAWQPYKNPYYKISLHYPINWNHADGEPRYGDRYSGPDGFFGINAISGETIDHAVEAEAYHHLYPYGSNPRIKKATVQGQEARLILPSIDAGIQNQAALIVRYPQPALINGHIYEFFVLYADADHIQALAETLKFM